MPTLQPPYQPHSWRRICQTHRKTNDRRQTKYRHVCLRKLWVETHERPQKGECMTDMNTCDKCRNRERSTDLVWITAEDFTPFPGEIVPAELYQQYDALCEDCYLEEV